MARSGTHITAVFSFMYSNLWVFVSKFTSFSPQKLHKVYKKAKKDSEQYQVFIIIDHACCLFVCCCLLVCWCLLVCCCLCLPAGSNDATEEALS